MGLITNKLLTQFFSQFAAHSGDTKRPTAWNDYGYPRQVTFDDLWSMYKRNGIGHAGVVRHIEKTWSSYPEIKESAEPHDPTNWERGLNQMIRRLNLWNMMKGADERNRVGQYAGLILILRDNKRLDEPVDRVPGGFDGLARVIPAFESQLDPVRWDTDPASPDYGQPTMYYFQETQIGHRKDEAPGRSVQVHPDRVVIWAEGADDGSIYGKPALEAGYNDPVTMEKIAGAGGEGFWKTARAAMSLDIDKDANLQNLARMLGTDVDGIPDKIEEVMTEFNSGADKSLLLQGIEPKPMSVNLPDPKEFFSIALQSFAASVSIPIPILLGHQTGERASTEDANEWATTIMSRRESFVIPMIEHVMDRLMQFGVVPQSEIYVEWQDLNAPSLGEQLDNAKKMADINKANQGMGVEVYTTDEMREQTDHEPLNDDGVFPEDSE